MPTLALSKNRSNLYHVLRLALLSLAMLVTAATRASAQDRDTGILYGDQFLFPGQSLSSLCGVRLDMQADGNLVIYVGATPIWASNTQGLGALAKMLPDGNFVVYDHLFRPVWATNTAGVRGGYLSMQWDKNLVVYNYQSRAYWASNTSNAPVQPGSGNCFANTSKTELSYGYDRPGSDYRSFYLNPGEGEYFCANYCQLDKTCVSFSYVPSNQLCYLKNGTPAAVSNKKVISGRVVRGTLSTRVTTPR